MPSDLSLSLSLLPRALSILLATAVALLPCNSGHRPRMRMGPMPKGPAQPRRHDPALPRQRPPLQPPEKGEVVNA
ncbi:unnamed protein product [Prunus armeniaca]